MAFMMLGSKAYLQGRARAGGAGVVCMYSVSSAHEERGQWAAVDEAIYGLHDVGQHGIPAGQGAGGGGGGGGEQ
jgi:hypothetical protein